MSVKSSLDAIHAVINHPATPYWQQSLLGDLLKRDIVDALAGLEQTLSLIKRLSDAIAHDALTTPKGWAHIEGGLENAPDVTATSALDNVRGLFGRNSNQPSAKR